MRVGIVADTHCPEFLPSLPVRLFELLEGVDLILHAGDVTEAATLDALREIAPVQAVRGDHDRRLDAQPEELQIELEGQRIAVVHGNRNRLIEEPVTFVGTISLGHFWPTPGLHPHLKRRFPAAGAIVYGHTHAASNTVYEGTLMFNPGAVYQVTPAEAERRLATGPNWFEWSWLQVIRRRRRLLPSSVGILEVDRQGVRGEILPL